MSSKPKLVPVTASLSDLHRLDALFEKQGSHFTAAKAEPVESSRVNLSQGESSQGNASHDEARRDNLSQTESSHDALSQVELTRVNTSHDEAGQGALSQGEARRDNLSHVESKQPAARQGAPRQSRAPQTRAKPAEPAEQGAAASKPFFGLKNRVTGYVTPEMAQQVAQLVIEMERSESWVVGKLIAEALAARQAK